MKFPLICVVGLALVVVPRGLARGRPAPPDEEQPAPDDQPPAPHEDQPPVPAQTPPDEPPAEPQAAPPAGAEPVRGDLPPGDAASVAGAPRPGQASGIAVPEENPAADKALWVPRVLLFVPRWTAWALSQPVRGAAWAYERYQVRERLKRIFFNDEETLGLYPVAFFETGFGFNFGGRAIARDVLGVDVKLRASYGGRYRQLYSVKLSTADRLAPLELELLAEYDIRAKDRFFGIGNGDETDLPPPAPVDALTDDYATEARFAQDVGKIDLSATTGLAGPLSLSLSTGLMFRSFGPSTDLGDGVALADAYLESSIVGFDRGLSASYSELELTLDTRRRTNIYVSEITRATGWLASAYLGYTAGFGDDESSYLRYGVDLQRYFDLYHGTRILWLRWFAESITGPLDEVPFVDLPRLGGTVHLRGYPADRFRDRAFTLGTAEYQWDLIDRVVAYTFVDAGHVWRHLRDIDGEGWRVGYGGGLQVQSEKSFLMRVDLSSSIDGGLFFNLRFDPVYDARTRVRK